MQCPNQNGASIRCDAEISRFGEFGIRRADGGKWMGQHAIAGGSGFWLWPMDRCPATRSEPGTWNLIEGFLYPTYQPANQFEAVWTSNRWVGNVWDVSTVGVISILAHS